MPVSFALILAGTVCLTLALRLRRSVRSGEQGERHGRDRGLLMARFLRILLRAVLTLIVVLGISVATRGYWMPERFAINIPIRALVGEAEGISAEAILNDLRLPPGFTLTRFATGVANARFVRVTETGDLVVSQPRESQVTLLFKDADGDGVSEGSIPLLTSLDRPHGLALDGGFLYVAEMTAVGRIRFDSATRKTSGAFERVITGLPGGGNHWTRTIGFGPDGFLYVSVGSSCNVCLEKDSRRAAISRYDPATWSGAIFASGLRNSVGFAWRALGEGPARTHELMATDNGRDLLGDNFPPCELNRIVKDGFYGWPFANGDRVLDPDLGTGHEKEVASSLAPIHNFAAHNAPLGLAFLESDSTPAGYRGAALVALHGSWNRTTKDGYKVVSLHWDEAGRITERDFLTGFLKDEAVIGRPVDVAQGADGSIFISDDYAGSIFRVTTDDRGPAPRGAATSGAGKAAPERGTRLAEDEDAAERGLRVWNANLCEQCHDPAIIGGDPDRTAKVLERLSSRYDVETMITYLRVPQPPMPVFEMTDQERHDLAVYVLERFP